MSLNLDSRERHDSVHIMTDTLESQGKTMAMVRVHRVTPNFHRKSLSQLGGREEGEALARGRKRDMFWDPHDGSRELDCPLIFTCPLQPVSPTTYTNTKQTNVIF